MNGEFSKLKTPWKTESKQISMKHASIKATKSTSSISLNHQNSWKYRSENSHSENTDWDYIHNQFSIIDPPLHIQLQGCRQQKHGGIVSQSRRRPSHWSGWKDNKRQRIEREKGQITWSKAGSWRREGAWNPPASASPQLRPPKIRSCSNWKIISETRIGI